MKRRSVLAILVFTTLVGVGLSVGWVAGWFRPNPPQPAPFVPQPLAADDHYGGHSLPRPKGFGPEARGPSAGYSNILPADYVGPNACANCHETQFQRWSAHPHRTMNQLPGKESVKGDFAGHVWTVRPGHSVTFSNEGDDYRMTVDRVGQKRSRYRVTRTVGSRFMQIYIGVQTEGAEPPGDARYTVEHKLPFAYWFRMKRWVPVDYIDAGDIYPLDDKVANLVVFDSRHPFSRTPKDAEVLLDGTPVVPGVDVPDGFVPYATCLHCHNTFPHAYRIFNPNKSGFPDALIEPDPAPLSAALAGRFEVPPTAEGLAVLPARVNPGKDLVTLGISCESCHLGGREHATLGKPPSFFPTSPHAHVTARGEGRPFTGKRADPATSQGICAQCHSGQAPTYPNLARTRSSAEVPELITSACATRLRCVDCHDPHTAGMPSGGPTLAKHLDTCVRCHSKYSTPEQAAAHSWHGSAAGVNCLDCHMPRITQGVDAVVRTHHIAPPVEQSMVQAGAPNACNLCHLDRSVRWTLDEVKKGWGRDIRPLDTTPPDVLDKPAGRLWLASHEPAVRMAAVDAYSRSPHGKSNLPAVLGGLDDVIPSNRPFALFAAERLLGRPLNVGDMDICAGPAQRMKQIEALRAILEKKR